MDFLICRAGVVEVFGREIVLEGVTKLA